MTDGPGTGSTRAVVIVLAFVVGLLGAFCVIGAWTVQSASRGAPEPDDDVALGWVPTPGHESGVLFGLARSASVPGGWVLEEEGAWTCVDRRSGTTPAGPGELSCDGHRFELVAQPEGSWLRYDGLELTLPLERDTTMGLAVATDAAALLPGLGATGLTLSAPSNCAQVLLAPPTPGAGAANLGQHPVVACVTNEGQLGSVVVDRSPWLLGEVALERVGPAEPLRVHASTAPVPLRVGDRLWAGLVPHDVRVRRDAGHELLVLDVPAGDSWLEVGTNRAWTELRLPGWRLSVGDAEYPRRWEFRSWEDQVRRISTGVGPSHVPHHRREPQQEERLQDLIDHHLLCWNPRAKSVDWNLDPRVDCMGEPRLLPPPARLLEQGQTLTSNGWIRRLLRRTAEAFDLPPGLYPSQAELAFVFDWRQGWIDVDGTRDRRLQPVRLLGVRPGHTEHRADSVSGKEGEVSDLCELDREQRRRLLPTMSVAAGSMSPWLSVEGETAAFADKAQLILASVPARDVDEQAAPAVGPGDSERTASPPLSGPAAEPAQAAVCVGPDPGAGEWVPSTANRVLKKKSRVASLGALTMTGPRARIRPRPGAPELQASRTCMLIRRSTGPERDLEAAFTGAGTITAAVGSVAASLASALQWSPLADGEEVALSNGTASLSVRVHDPKDPAIVARSALQDGHRQDRYPMGPALANVLGVEGVYGGLRSSLSREVREAYWERADKGCDPDDKVLAAPATVETTLQGDIQRILFEELATVVPGCTIDGQKSEDGRELCLRGGLDVPSIEDVHAEAVLLDAGTGAILAAANYPSFDPEDPEFRDELKRQIRWEGRGFRPGRVLENQAFKRRASVGSVYKLAASYGLARAGYLTGGSGSGEAITCSHRFLLAQKNAAQPGTPLIYAQGPKAAAPEAIKICNGGPATITTNYSDSFPGALRKSRNRYFSLGVLLAAPRTGVGLRDFRVAGATEYQGWYSPSTPGATTPPSLWSSDDGATLGVVFPADFDPGADLGHEDNEFLHVLLSAGHRLMVLKPGAIAPIRGRGTRRIGDHVWKAQGESSWLQGIDSGGFAYPAVWDPISYALEPRPGQTRTLEVVPDDGGSPYSITVQTEIVPLINYVKTAYGMGGAEASALSMAALGAISFEGDAIAPQILTDYVPTTGAVVVEEDLLQEDPQEDRRGAIQVAMKDVVRSGTASDKFEHLDVLQGAIGSKTGTFTRNGGSAARRQTHAGAVSKFIDHACGVADSGFDAGDWTTIRGLVTGSTGASLRRSYPWVEHPAALDLPELPLGFGASAPTCSARAPVVPGAGAELAGVDGGTWLQALAGPLPGSGGRALLRPLEATAENIGGSALVSVAFGPLAEGATTALGQGLVLAVVMDGNQSGAKWASVRILERLRQHYVVLAE